MPHRPEGQGSSSSVYTPPRVTGSTAAAIMRQQTNINNSHSQQHSQQLNAQTTTAALQQQYGALSHSLSPHSQSCPSGVVTPVVKLKGARGIAWLSTMGCSTINKSSDSTDRSTAATDDSRSIATVATEDEREATASALLSMVAKAAEREHQQHYLKGMVVDGSVSSSASTGSSSTVPGPLKKRKKQLDILRRQQEQQTDVDSSNNNNKNACHISPGTVSSDTPPRRMDNMSNNNSVNNTPVATSNRAHSYDSKCDSSYTTTGVGVSSSSKRETTKELLDSSKVHSTAQIGAPSQALTISHFPTVLHQVLADQELLTDGDNSKVIQWLPDGEAWKVIRWDAMRRQVLPKYFSDLTDEHGSSCGSIDAFLYHIDAWGFEEIKNGTNAGAYRHDVSYYIILLDYVLYLRYQRILHLTFLFLSFIHYSIL